jgi:formate dehydrogenase major subunit
MSEAFINGRAIIPLESETILEAAKRLSVEIPTICHSDRLHAEGGCRICLVECEGETHPMAACHSEIRPGMIIHTNTEKIETLRAQLHELYDHHRESSTPCSPAAQETHPYLSLDLTACINCRLCLNACEQIQGQFVFSVSGRGSAKTISIGDMDTFADSPCVACGACADICPTDAIIDRDTLNNGDHQKAVTSTCGYCGVGCQIEVEVDVDANDVMSIKGVSDAAVNNGHLCAKGRFSHSYLKSGDRLTHPLIKSLDGSFKEASWGEALELITTTLGDTAKKYGPSSVGAFTSSRTTNEACYLLQKYFRSILLSNNVDCCARVCHSSTALALQLVTGTGAASSSYQDIEASSCILVAGANPTEAHPIVGARIKQQVLGGTPLIVVDPRKIELTEYADVHLQLTPGTNVALFNGLAKILYDRGDIDEPYLLERIENYEEFKVFIDTISLAEIVETTGVDLESMHKAASLISSTEGVGTLFVHGLGLSELEQGTASVMTLCNLGMLTGSIGKPGSGMLPLRGQNNVQGSADMGSMPDQFTGYQSVADPSARERVQKIWGSLPPEEPGLTIPEMIDAAADGSIRGLWIQGEDIAQSDPNESHVRAALEALDFLVVQEIFFSETCHFANVILPSASYLEQEGTFTNGERRIQHVQPAVTPPGESLPDWLVVRDAANLAGAEWRYQHPAEVMDEIARIAPHLFGGVSYSRLKKDGLQWPCPSVNSPGTSTVHSSSFLRGKGSLTTIDYAPSSEHHVSGYPYLLITGRILHHYNVGTMTRRSGQSSLTSRDFLEINPEDAKRENIRDGDIINIQSRWGQIAVPIKHSARTAPNTLFLSFHFPETHTNQLTGPALDPMSKCPQYKATAVKLLV